MVLLASLQTALHERIGALAVLFAAICAAVSAAPAQARIMIANVSVIPMDRDGVIAGRDVIIDDGRILAIEPHGTSAPQEGDDVIDGSGRYLMPALWDMHVHLTVPLGTEPITMQNVIDYILPRYTGYGIAGVRDLGSTLDNFTALRAAIADRPDLPDWVASGPLFEGARFRWSKAVAVHAENAEQGRALAEQLADAGVDFFKVYDTLPAEAFYAIAEVAEERGLPLAGHIPFSIGTQDAIRAGQRFIEHSYVDLVTPCNGGAPDLRISILRIWMEQGWGGKYEETARILAEARAAGCGAVFARYADAGVAVTPMLQMELPTDYAADAGMRSTVAQRGAAFCANAMTMAAAAPVEAKTALRGELFALVRGLHDAGVTLLAGTDNGGDCRSDGYSLHRELQLFVEAGLPAQAALRTATLNAANMLERPDEGRVAVGARANLLLLAANPLDDIANTTAIAMMIEDGRVIDTAELAAMRALDMPMAE